MTVYVRQYSINSIEKKYVNVLLKKFVQPYNVKVLISFVIKMSMMIFTLRINNYSCCVVLTHMRKKVVIC